MILYQKELNDFIDNTTNGIIAISTLNLLGHYKGIRLKQSWMFPYVDATYFDVIEDFHLCEKAKEFVNISIANEIPFTVSLHDYNLRESFVYDGEIIKKVKISSFLDEYNMLLEIKNGIKYDTRYKEKLILDII